MKRARKSSNRVSWATGGNLCQVKLFVSEDCPSKVGQKSQDHLQAKTSSMLHSNTTEYNDLPPGFECNQFLNQSTDELYWISQIHWRCPPPFVFSHNWHVAAGEESRENEDQKLRELRVLEAVYPRLSAIPPRPSVSLDVEEEDFDDNLTPLVPIIPIEEEESMDDQPVSAAAVMDALATVQSQNLYLHTLASTTPVQCNTSSVASHACGNPLPGISPGSEVDLAAASAAVAAVMKSKELGSLIDMDLLVRIFNDPVMIEKLVNDDTSVDTTVTASSNSTVSISTSGLKPATPSVPLSTATSTLGLLSASGMKPATPSVSLLTLVPEKPATPSVPMSRPMPGKPATPSVLLPIPGKPATPSVPLHTPALEMHRPVNKNIHHMSNGVLPSVDTQPPQQDTILASGAKHAASLTSIPMTSSGGNMHPVKNLVRSAANTMPYQASTASAFAVKEAHPVKDANYLKNLIRQHGSDEQDTQDSQLGVRHSNFKDLKLAHNNKPGEVKFKIQKTCIFFNSSRGCRNGSSCPYLHDMSVQCGAGTVLGAQNAKRLKLGHEINGRM